MSDTRPTDTEAHAATDAQAAAPDPAARGTPVHATTAEARSDDKGKAMAVYVLYLASFVVGFTSIIGVVLAYLSKGDADSMIRSHYDNAINVFWKGLLYSIVAGLLTLVVIGFVLLFVVAVWVIVRCVKGLLALNEGKPYPNPGSWGF